MPVSIAWVSVIMLLAAMAPVFGASLSPCNVGNKAQLFVDQVLVRSAENVVLTLHRGGPERKLLTLRWQSEVTWCLLGIANA